MKTTIYVEPKIKITFLSYCCGELPLGELDQGNAGFCSKCKDGTQFDEYVECMVCGDLKLKGENCEMCNDWKMD